jgi:hypothetical protein
MFCPHCGKENAGPFGYCIVCGKPLSMVEGAPAITPAAPASPKPMNVAAMLGIGATVALAAVVAFTKPVDKDAVSDVPFRIGTLIGMMLIPLIVAFLVAGRKSARKPNLFALIFCLGSLVFIGANWVSSLSAWRVKLPDSSRSGIPALPGSASLTMRCAISIATWYSRTALTWSRSRTSI